MRFFPGIPAESREVSSHPGAKRARVDRSADVRVVVEIGKHIASALRGGPHIRGDPAGIVGFEPRGPQLDACGPMIEGLVRIAAGMELLGAVQAQTDKIGGHILGVGPRHPVGDDERYPVAQQKRDEGRVRQSSDGGSRSRAAARTGARGWLFWPVFNIILRPPDIR